MEILSVDIINNAVGCLLNTFFFFFFHSFYPIRIGELILFFSCLHKSKKAKQNKIVQIEFVKDSSVFSHSNSLKIRIEFHIKKSNNGFSTKWRYEFQARLFNFIMNVINLCVLHFRRFIDLWFNQIVSKIIQFFFLNIITWSGIENCTTSFGYLDCSRQEMCYFYFNQKLTCQEESLSF